MTVIDSLTDEGLAFACRWLQWRYRLTVEQSAEVMAFRRQLGKTRQRQREEAIQVSDFCMSLFGSKDC